MLPLDHVFQAMTFVKLPEIRDTVDFCLIILRRMRYQIHGIWILLATPKLQSYTSMKKVRGAEEFFVMFLLLSITKSSNIQFGTQFLYDIKLQPKNYF